MRAKGLRGIGGTMNNKSGLSKWAIAILILGVLLLLGSCSFDSMASFFIWGAVLCGILLLAIAIIIACVAVKQSGDEAKAGNGGNATKITGTSTSARKGTTTGTSTSKRLAGTINASPELKAARQMITDERQLATRIADGEVRAAANKVLDGATKCLETLATKPQKIATSNQFLNYYLPTLGLILKKFRSIEESGVGVEATQMKVVKYLEDISQVMDKQYENLYSDDILDLAVEMEAMTISCKRDGLLSDEDVKVFSSEQPISLEL